MKVCFDMHATVQLQYMYMTCTLFEDIVGIAVFHFFWHLLFSPLVGGFWSAIKFYLLVRVFVSLWFYYITQVNHVHLEIYSQDDKLDWFTLQVIRFCYST